MSKLILYSTGCPKCNVLTKKLEKAGLDFTVEEDEAKIIAACKKAAVDSLPLLETGSGILNFNEAIKWVGEQSAI